MRSPTWLTANDCLVRSAKDKAILEAAYNANPKPDKAARLDIVKRVSLNEKEVQVRLSLVPSNSIARAMLSIGQRFPSKLTPCARLP